MPDDMLSSIALVAFAEIPAYLGNDTHFTKLDLKSFFTSVNAFLMDIIGRKPIILLSMLVAAIASLVLILPTPNWVFIGGLLIMKSTVAGVFTLIRIYTIELYPRVLKGKAFGLCKALASFAAIFSPLLTIIPLYFKKGVIIG